MAINEQTKAAKKLYISLSQSDEISAKPDTSPLTFHEALNPTITSRAIATFGIKELGKKWWIVYADYAFGKQNTAVFSAIAPKLGGTVLGSTPYPLGKPEFSAHLPKIQAAKPDVIYAITPGADSVPFLKQAISFGLKKDAKIVQPLHFLDYTKEGGADAFQDVYGATHFCHELAETMPQAKRYVDAYTKKFNRPPDSYSGYGYNGIKEIARGVELAKSTDPEAVANALRKNREYDHYKGKQWWRACDNKSFQDLWILKVRSPQQVKGEWGFFDVVGRVPANEELDRTCAEKGLARGRPPPTVAPRRASLPPPEDCAGKARARADIWRRLVLIDISVGAAAQAFTGLVLGGILVLMAIGLSLIFGLMTVVNFSHGALYMLGAYVAFTILGFTRSFWAALILAP